MDRGLQVLVPARRQELGSAEEITSSSCQSSGRGNGSVLVSSPSLQRPRGLLEACLHRYR